MAGSHPIKVDRYREGSWERTDSEVIIESAVSLTVNGELWLTFRCTPIDLKALAVGFLFNEGIIQAITEIASVQVCAHEDNIDIWINHRIKKPASWQRTSGCIGGVTSVGSVYNLPPLGSSTDTITPEHVKDLIRMLIKAQVLYRSAGGVHTTVLTDGRALFTSAEDIGRHNTLDKIAGLCLLQDLHPERKILLTTGRVSSEMIQKAARIGSSIIISRTSPSSLSIPLAKQMGIILIGYARGNEFCVYTYPERVVNIRRGKNDPAIVHAPLSASKEVL